MAKIKWHCDQCKKTGEVEFSDGDFVIDLVNRLKESHGTECSRAVSRLCLGKAPSDDFGPVETNVPDPNEIGSTGEPDEEVTVVIVGDEDEDSLPIMDLPPAPEE